MVRLLERRFRVKAPLERAWSHLEKVEQWPSWARHIRRIEVHPSGPFRPDTEGTLVLSNGFRSIFRMEQLNPGANWKWAGPFLWLTVHYDHRLARAGPEESEIAFVVDGEGFGVAVFGRLFAAIYARSLDRAIPRLIHEIEGGRAPVAPQTPTLPPPPSTPARASRTAPRRAPSGCASSPG
jgi:hypothetical protein